MNTPRSVLEDKEASNALQACLFLGVDPVAFSILHILWLRKVEFTFYHSTGVLTLYLRSLKKRLSIQTCIHKVFCPLTSPRPPPDSYDAWRGQFAVVQLPGRASVIVLWTPASCPYTQQQCTGLNSQAHNKFMLATGFPENVFLQPRLHMHTVWHKWTATPNIDFKVYYCLLIIQELFW